MKPYMIQISLAPVAASALATALVAPANAMSQTASVSDPVAIKRFSACLDYSTATPFYGADRGSEASVVTISFADTANLPIKRVVFAVRAGNYRSLIVDKGTFSPGTRITHSFLRNRELGQGSTVKVLNVTFADGSTWRS
jgi:hypothetical protein